MKLVVDTNILFSFFRENIVRELIVGSPHNGLELLTHPLAFCELRKNKNRVMKYAGIKTDEDFDYVLTVLEFYVKVANRDPTPGEIKNALKICPHSKDAPFFEIAIALSADIWSKEPRLKKQSVVKVYTTKEVVNEMGSMEKDKGPE
jgi:predicted nucleic acid-binding protein